MHRVTIAKMQGEKLDERDPKIQWPRRRSNGNARKNVGKHGSRTQNKPGGRPKRDIKRSDRPGGRPNRDIKRSDGPCRSWSRNTSKKCKPGKLRSKPGKLRSKSIKNTMS